MKKLVNYLIENGSLRSEKIAGAFLKINRRDFVLSEHESEADKNISLPIGLGKQIMQPQKAVFILENLDLQSGQKVLCVGSDSGWIPNLLAEIVGEKGEIIALDEISKLTEMAQENSRKYDFLKNGRIKFIVSEEIKGFPPEAPYDRIISLISFSQVPENLKKQLKVGGKMLIPIKGHYILVERKMAEHFLEDDEIQLKDLKNRFAQKIYSRS